MGAPRLLGGEPDRVGRGRDREPEVHGAAACYRAVGASRSGGLTGWARRAEAGRDGLDAAWRAGDVGQCGQGGSGGGRRGK